MIRDLFPPPPPPQAVGNSWLLGGPSMELWAEGARVGHMSSRRQCRRQLQFFAYPLLFSPQTPSIYLATSPPYSNPTPKLTRARPAHPRHRCSFISSNTHHNQSEAAASCSELPTMKVTFKVGLAPPHRGGRVGQQRLGGGQPVSPTAPSPRSSTCPPEQSISANSSSSFPSRT